MIPSILQINRKPRKKGEAGLPKISIEEAKVTSQGIEGDFNRYRTLRKNSDPDMALLILSDDIINQLNREGWPVLPGDLGENLTLTNIDYSSILPGQNYKIGNIQIMISFICDPCSYLEVLPYVGEIKLIDFIKTLKNRRGWYARVVRGGQIFAGDLVKII